MMPAYTNGRRIAAKALLDGDPRRLGVRAGTSGPEPLHHRFARYDGLVHDDRHRCRETRDDKCVETVPEQMEHQSSADHRYRHRNHADQRGSPVEAQREERDEQQAGTDRGHDAQVARGRLDVIGRCEQRRVGLDPGEPWSELSNAS